MSTEQAGESAGQPTGNSGRLFDVATVNAALAGTVFAGKVHHFALVASTQTLALAAAAEGAEAGQVYIADEQTAGRGRGGHTWHSEPDRGLYLTVLVRPALQSNEVLTLSLATALACKAALRQAAGITVDLRWPNDLVYAAPKTSARKLGGILTETASTPAGVVRHAAIGIGINLNQVDFPEELRDTATSVRAVTGSATSRTDVAVSLLRHMDRELALLAGGQTAAALLQRFAQASTWVSGKRVTVAEDDGYTGVTAGLTADGLLRVQDDTGTMHVVRHGGVREAR